MTSKGEWILIDTLQFIDNVFASLATDEPLHITYRRLFSAVVGKLKIYARCSHGLHLMGNIMFGRDGESNTAETDHIYLDPDSEWYLGQALMTRHGSQDADVDSQLPPCTHRRYGETWQADGLKSRLNGLLEKCPMFSPVVNQFTAWEELFSSLGGDPSTLLNGGIPSNGIDCAGSEVLVISLSDPTGNLLCGQLGTILLWNQGAEPLERVCRDRGERLKSAAKTLSVFVSRLLTSQFGVREDTYLPSYRNAGQRPVSVLFADIRDFTPTTEICRNFNLVNELTEFIKDYTREMSSLVQKENGRVHGLTGDGIMAIFGEYDLDPRKSVERAIDAAKKMCSTFDALKSEFFGNPRIEEFFQNEYEPMDMRLGIGISFGPVIFDYFGLPGSRTYGPLGDHVNFAQRLESEANRFDPLLTSRKDPMRSPILVSRPAWIAAGRNPAVGCLGLSVKGKPHEYQCYECWPDGD